MKKNAIIVIIGLALALSLYQNYRQSKQKGAYQLYLEGDYYHLKDGDRSVWKDKFGSGSDIDHIVIQDNL